MRSQCPEQSLDVVDGETAEAPSALPFFHGLEFSGSLSSPWCRRQGSSPFPRSSRGFNVKDKASLPWSAPHSAFVTAQALCWSLPVRRASSAVICLVVLWEAFYSLSTVCCRGKKTWRPDSCLSRSGTRMTYLTSRPEFPHL